MRQLEEVRGAEQRAARCQRHDGVYGNHVGPTSWNGDQMLAFAMEVDSILAPGVEIGDELELLAGPRVKWVNDSETSTQTVCMTCS